MSNIIGVINKLCAEVRSEKISTRNKAAEDLDNHLSSSKSELLLQLAKRHNDDVSWTTIFKSAIDATIKVKKLRLKQIIGIIGYLRLFILKSMPLKPMRSGIQKTTHQCETKVPFTGLSLIS